MEYRHICTPSAKDISVGTEGEMMFNRKLIWKSKSNRLVEQKETEVLEELSVPGQKNPFRDYCSFKSAPTMQGI